MASLHNCQVSPSLHILTNLRSNLQEQYHKMDNLVRFRILLLREMWKQQETNSSPQPTIRIREGLWLGSSIDWIWMQLYCWNDFRTHCYNKEAKLLCKNLWTKHVVVNNIQTNGVLIQATCLNFAMSKLLCGRGYCNKITIAWNTSFSNCVSFNITIYYKYFFFLFLISENQQKILLLALNYYVRSS